MPVRGVFLSATVKPCQNGLSIGIQTRGRAALIGFGQARHLDRIAGRGKDGPPGLACTGNTMLRAKICGSRKTCAISCTEAVGRPALSSTLIQWATVWPSVTASISRFSKA